MQLFALLALFLGLAAASSSSSSSSSSLSSSSSASINQDPFFVVFYADEHCSTIVGVLSMPASTDKSKNQTLVMGAGASCAESIACLTDADSDACAAIKGATVETGAQIVDEHTVMGYINSDTFYFNEGDCKPSQAYAGCYDGVVLSSTLREKPYAWLKSETPPAPDKHAHEGPWAEKGVILYYEDAHCTRPRGYLEYNPKQLNHIEIATGAHCKHNVDCISAPNSPYCKEVSAGTGEFSFDVLPSGVVEYEAGTGSGAEHESEVIPFGGCAPSSVLAGCYYSIERLDTFSLDPQSAQLKRPSADAPLNFKIATPRVLDAAGTHVAVAQHRANKAAARGDIGEMRALRRELCARSKTLPDACMGDECRARVLAELSNGCEALDALIKSHLSSTSSSSSSSSS